MSDKANWQGNTQVVEGDVAFQGTVRFLAGTNCIFADPTDSTKTCILDLSGLPTGTRTDLAIPDSDSSIVTLSGTQTLTNKTLTAPALNGGTWVATDSTFTIADNTTPTKIARFECSDLTAGTNVFTLPNTAADTFVTLAANQTLTTKTLTAPTINAATLTGTISGGTFTSTTLTAPTINAATLTGAISGGTFSSSTLTAPTINAATLTGAISGGTVAPTTLTVPASTSLTTPAIAGATLTGTITRAGVQYFIPVNGIKVGATAGWTVGAGADTYLATVAASQTAATATIGISGLGIGWVITAFSLVGNLTSAGNHVTIDAALRKGTAAAAGPTDALIAAMTQLDVVANTAMSAANTNKGSLSYTVAVNENVYMLLTVTTDSSTTAVLQGILLTVTQN